MFLQQLVVTAVLRDNSELSPEPDDPENPTTVYDRFMTSPELEARIQTAAECYAGAFTTVLNTERQTETALALSKLSLINGFPLTTLTDPERDRLWQVAAGCIVDYPWGELLAAAGFSDIFDPTASQADAKLMLDLETEFAACTETVLSTPPKQSVAIGAVTV
ncbi:MAG: hypothetical protein OXB92_05735 [Acidimicrobiaceae bacterium]|nr:hypothetical protein [Acidimicrobiia bacterium]MCY4493339.1 hypothetical protein [Acidimicrobiaceae bacterium]